MLGFTTAMASLLSRYYDDNNKVLAKSLARVASGKRIVNAGDDFSGFIRATTLQIEAGLYDDIKNGIEGAKGLADYAVETGSAVVDDLSRLRTLAELYNDTVDPVAQASYEAEFDATKAKIDSLVSSARYDGQQVYNTGSLNTVSVNPTGGSLSLSISDAADTTSISTIDDYPNVVTTVETEIISAATYLAEAEAFADQLDVFSNLSDTAADDKRANAAAITDVNDLEELAKITDIQVRQQAVMAMFSQANIARAAISKLFGSSD